MTCKGQSCNLKRLLELFWLNSLLALEHQRLPFFLPQLPRFHFDGASWLCVGSTGGRAATPIATTPIQELPALPQSFFCRPAEEVAPELIGCLLVKCQPNGELLWGVIVETEAYCQSEPACHGHRRRTPSNETLFGEPGRFYVYVSYGIHHCVKRAVT
jgi:DNA-3-methyladenine glycosylase